MPNKPVLLTTSIEKLLESLKANNYSGRVQLMSTQNQQWFLYLHLGRFIYASGGCHPVRRFYRQVNNLLPEFNWYEVNQIITDTPELSVIETLGWEYECFRLWHRDGYLNRGQALHLITNILIEILFDMMQADAISYQLNTQDKTLQTHAISLLDPVRITALAHQQLQFWANSPLVKFSPNLAVHIRDLNQFNHGLFSHLGVSLPPSFTAEELPLRDLAYATHKEVSDLAIAIAPMIQEDYVELLEVPDLPRPICGSRLMEMLQKSSTHQGKLIACVDESMMVQLMMENIFQETPYRMISIHDALLTLPLLLDNQPDLIFLNLEMPRISGYDLCLQIRKTTVLKDIPIVFLVENQTLFQRMQVKLSGATDSLVKPLTAEAVMAMTQKLLAPQDS